MSRQFESVRMMVPMCWLICCHPTPPGGGGFTRSCGWQENDRSRPTDPAAGGQHTAQQTLPACLRSLSAKEERGASNHARNTLRWRSGSGVRPRQQVRRSRVGMGRISTPFRSFASFSTAPSWNPNLQDIVDASDQRPKVSQSLRRG
jgi:hypothetical protein